MSSLDESERSNRRRENVYVFIQKPVLELWPVRLGPKKKITAPSYFSFVVFFRLAIGKSVNVRLARQTRLFKIWATSLKNKIKRKKKKKNIIYRKLIKNGAAEPFGKRGCSTWPLEHSEFFFFLIFLLLIFFFNWKIAGGTRENPAWFRTEKEEILWGGRLRIRPAFLLKQCKMCACVYALEKCLRVS